MKARGLNPIARCPGCGGWRWYGRRHDPCRTCVLIGLHRAMEQVRAHG